MDVLALHGFVAETGRSWDEVAVVDAVRHGTRHALNVCRARSAVVVAGADPAELARGLSGWRRSLVVRDASGVSTVDPADAVVRRWDEPDAVLCLSETAYGAPVDAWALPDDDFAHRSDGLLAVAEVRAFVLSRLGPRPGGLVWDLAAGPGAVAVECARLGAAVVAVEGDAVQCVRIVANAAAHGVDVRVAEQDPAGACDGLPRPDAVHVGGGDPDVVRRAAAVRAQRVVVTTGDLDRVLPARDLLADAGYVVEGTQLSAARLVQGALSASNPVTVLWGTRDS
ncbi:hypothetical protein GCM10022243_36400 [Saccharothrix violaceirubra]|uniref:Precorrin-6Y C5,15-methyltransferase (Decarboxylating) n=1 Tax=Saccharothrix violaceirubra TaxID=413306 RepID=A0A7W7SZV0_9PSEU|nr:hypothetical protein [Saccharothrix violaceirubra]MBB4964012.1 precorrin-6Y C5,15-methyltransferase (decarboxylating) [Saccharothrix violaceirubra]